MLHKKHLVIFALFIILIICISQKMYTQKEGFFFNKKNSKANTKKDKKLEKLEKINKQIERNINQKKKDLRIEKNRETINNILVELHENIGSENVRNLYYKNKDRSHKNYNKQQEGLNNLAKYIKNYND